MYDARQCKITARERSYFITIAGVGNKIREKKHDAPDQRMHHEIKIPVFYDPHHYATHCVLQ
jgi:hypothetical protein